MIPVVCVMEWILHSKHYSREVKASVMVVVIGVGICTVTDVKVNAKGFICACTAVFSTSLQQIVSILTPSSLPCVILETQVLKFSKISGGIWRKTVFLHRSNMVYFCVSIVSYKFTFLFM